MSQMNFESRGSVLLLLLFSVTSIIGGTACRNTATGPQYKALRPLLNSERIERIFGSYGIEVLESERIRVSNLYSQENDRKVCRTLAIVDFSDSIPEALSAPYREIREGGSLGATLKKAGWEIEKRHEFFGKTTAGDRFKDLAHLQLDAADRRYALHIYTLWAKRDEQRHPFSTIAEIHHPEYLDLKDLKGIYKTDLSGNLSADTSDLKMIAIAQSVSEY
jgi:hypothetical protein